MKASASIVIERPMHAVWNWASDPKHWHQWQGDVSAETVGDRITARHVYGDEAGIAVYEVTESTPPRRQIIRSVSGPYRFSGVLELFEDVGGTRVRQTAIVDPTDIVTRIVFVFARPLVRRSIRRRIAAQLERLKTMVELEAVL